MEQPDDVENLEADAAVDGQGPEGPNGLQDTTPVDLLRCCLCHTCIFTFRLVCMFSTINIRPVMFECQLWSANNVLGRYAYFNILQIEHALVFCFAE